MIIEEFRKFILLEQESDQTNEIVLKTQEIDKASWLQISFGGPLW